MKPTEILKDYIRRIEEMSGEDFNNYLIDMGINVTDFTPDKPGSIVLFDNVSNNIELYYSDTVEATSIANIIFSGGLNVFEFNLEDVA
jgi:hypothetical protein